MPIDRSLYPGIPEDFPIVAEGYSLSGAQPKINVVKVDGRFYEVGTSPREIAEAYEVSEDLAQQMVAYCRRKQAEAPQPHEQLLQKVLQSLYKKDWVRPAHSRWIVDRTRQLLGWDIPTA